MKLRKLEQRDAVRMLEWMHDESIVKYMGTDFSKKTIDDCKRFIRKSLMDDENFNLAVADDNDVYMGTVSLKHIDRDAKNAEFAITMHADALGRGYARYGMNEIIQRGFEQFGLEEIYWCVSISNVRAIRFYDKNLYVRTNEIPKQLKRRYSDVQQVKLVWYVVRNGLLKERI